VATSRLARHAEAVAEIARATIALRVAAPGRAASVLGEVDTAPAPAASLAQLRAARTVADTVARDACRLPWHPTCLRQAVAVQRMLRRRGIPGRLHLGVASVAEAEAHAWVTVGESTVIGAGERDRFVPLAVFA
jgi:hypothetical protein